MIPSSDSIHFELTVQGEAVQPTYLDLLHHVTGWGPTGSGKSSFFREEIN